MGLELGADDYMTKPFSIRELKARVNVQLRRRRWQGDASAQKQTTMSFGGLRVDRSMRTATLHQRPVELTATEFDLLACLMATPGRVFTRHQLLDQVWGYSHIGYERTVISHINRLRRKIDPDPVHPEYIETVRGVGYRFRDHATQPMFMSRA